MHGDIECAKPQTCESLGPRETSVMEKLQHRRAKAVQELEEIDKAIAVFERHPEVEQALTQLARVGIYR